jgi:hypothetical protein
VKIIICIICVILLAAGLVFYKLSTIEIKDLSQIYVQGTFDYEMMINPPEEYSALYQIDLSMREQVAEYMKTNNYKLKEGEQEFIKNDPTFDELINNGFLFEKIE